MYKQDLALNNLQRLICYRTQSTHKLTGYGGDSFRIIVADPEGDNYG